MTYLVRQDGVWPFTAPAGLLGEELKLLTTRTEAQTHGPIEPCQPPGQSTACHCRGLCCPPCAKFLALKIVSKILSH